MIQKTWSVPAGETLMVAGIVTSWVNGRRSGGGMALERRVDLGSSGGGGYH